MISQIDMPSSKARDSPSVERRDRLTLAKLASYDDVATDALVDRVRHLTQRHPFWIVSNIVHIVGLFLDQYPQKSYEMYSRERGT